ncbi:ankyrin repeat domain-containing protein [Candidatus Cardinium hertigii]|uniref:ankyrin repeat domain-containing protein n=1 Tax=Candidatus Cardinium hertigii TaxID=247481 RepID=UPI001FA9DC9A|nr:ankyrin repeat domain-containing protein [Candidatus Cardinium hertigii]
MQYDRAFIKPTSLIRAVWICVFVLTSACNKIKNTYNISKSSNQLYTFFNSEINCCNDYTSLEPNNYNKEFVEYIIERLKCCYASYEKIDKDTTDEDIKQYIKCMLYDCNVNVFKDIVTYSIDTINSSGQTNQKRSVILFFYDLLISLLNTFPSRWNSAIEANNQYDSISSPILEKIAFISKMLASCLQQEEKAKNSSFSDQLEVLKSLINKHIFERLKFKEALLSAANYGHVKLIGTLLRMVLELSGPKQYLKMLCTPLDVGTNSDNKWNTMLARALLSCSYAEEVIECLVSNLSHVMNYFPQDIAIKSYFLDQPVQSTPTKYQTALYLAIENNEPALVQCLLKLGANPNIRR